MLIIENGLAKNKAAGFNEIKPRQPTGDDIYKDIRKALYKHRGGPSKRSSMKKGTRWRDQTYNRRRSNTSRNFLKLRKMKGLRNPR
jgi:hypothetical protein